MSESTAATTEPATESTFGPILAKAGVPAKVQAKITRRLDDLYNLVISHNSRVLRIQQTKATDPNNAEVLDSIWANRVESKSAPAEIIEAEQKYDALRDEAEKLLKKLREFAKTQIEPPLSADQMEAERKAANEEAKLIDESKSAATAMAEMADEFLELAEESVPGGIMSLIPQVESLKNTRGRKASTGGTSGEGLYRTRISARAMYEAFNATYRDAPSLPVELDFDFTKDVAVQRPNDDSVTIVPVTKKFHVVRNVPKKVTDESADTDESVDVKSDEVKSDATDEVKSEVKPEVVPAENAPVESAPVAPAENAPSKMGPAATALKAKQEAMKAAQQKK
jgi:virulence-associated protein VagC